MSKPTVLLFMALLLSGAAQAGRDIPPENLPDKPLYCTESENAGLFYEGGRWQVAKGGFQQERFTVGFKFTELGYHAKILDDGLTATMQCKTKGRRVSCSNGWGLLNIDLDKMRGHRSSAFGWTFDSDDRGYDTVQISAFTCQAF